MKNLLKIFAATLLLLTGCSVFKPTADNITKAELKNEPPLVYPIEAQKSNIEGNVSVIFIITKDGSVGQTKIFNTRNYNYYNNGVQEITERLRKDIGNKKRCLFRYHTFSFD